MGKELNQVMIQKAEALPEGWNWYMYEDGSGYLQAPDGKEYFFYDKNTSEYKQFASEKWSLWFLGIDLANGMQNHFTKFLAQAEDTMRHYIAACEAMTGKRSTLEKRTYSEDGSKHLSMSYGSLCL